MRSPQELAFRLRQETANLLLLVHPPNASREAKTPLAGLPDPRRVATLVPPAYAGRIVALAEEILRHRFPLLGCTVETGPSIEWRRDPISGKQTGLDYFRRIPYLDFERAGDHKIIWELNRHQHLVLLAQAYLLSGDQRFSDEIPVQLESWRQQNPYGRGMNWTSALEVAFRALSWIWVYHLAGERMSESFRRRFLSGLYAHGRYLEFNLSDYFSPNTHLLGEAVALHALGTCFPAFPGAARWKREGGSRIRAHMREKVQDDGSYFEQSTYYHVYAMDMFVFAAAMEEMPADYFAKLRLMGEYTDALLGPGRRLPFLGDDDGGRFFHAYGDRTGFARGSLAACAQVAGGAWEYTREDAAEFAVWLTGRCEDAPAPGGRVSRLFSESGVAVMESGSAQVIVDAGRFGPFASGHSHSDTLSIIVRRSETELLVDPGTYTYVAEPRWRDWFRGSAAHSTIRIDGLDQGTIEGPFRWSSRPQVNVRRWESGPERDVLDAVCEYRGLSHRRQVVFAKPDVVFVLDTVEGPAGEHLVEQFWHPAGPVAGISAREFSIGGDARLLLTLDAECEEAWISPAPGKRVTATAIKLAVRGRLPLRIGAAIVLAGGAGPLQLLEKEEGAELKLTASRVPPVLFGA